MTVNASQQAIIDQRRERVAYWRLQRLPIRAIQSQLAIEGHCNPDDDEPWSVGTIQSDVDAIRAEWQRQAQGDTALLLSEEMAALDSLLPNAFKCVAQGRKEIIGYTEELGSKGQVIRRIPMFRDVENPEAIKTTVKLLESRRKLLGLDKALTNLTGDQFTELQRRLDLLTGAELQEPSVYQTDELASIAAIASEPNSKNQAGGDPTSDDIARG